MSEGSVVMKGWIFCQKDCSRKKADSESELQSGHCVGSKHKPSLSFLHMRSSTQQLTFTFVKLSCLFSWDTSGRSSPETRISAF